MNLRYTDADMALFQKKPQTSSSAPLYSLGLSKTVLVIGLGNPGKKYDLTRHNVGFHCVDAFVESQQLGPWVNKKDLKCLESSGNVGGTRIIVIKPTTYMNSSGEAVQAVMHFYKVPINQVVAIYDELAIDYGQIRSRIGGSSAGHNGVKSIIQHVGADFGRLRVGIKNELATRTDASEFVLSKFSKKEQGELPNMTREINALIIEYVYSMQLPADTRSFLV
ncbi:MAG: hypothetical protein NVS1B7_5950 [Candidatus Saccharimonadales bacterium]